jgi:hypothetical protein
MDAPAAPNADSKERAELSLWPFGWKQGQLARDVAAGRR